MCLYPRLIKNRKYTSNKKNGGVIPPVTDPRALYVPIGCGNCMECRKQKAREWQIRLTVEAKHNINGKFITLTFSNESIKKLLCENSELQRIQGYELDNALATRAVRLWLERWRKMHKKSLRHWLVTELGHEGTENIHLHGIIWTEEPIQKIESTWKYGFVWPTSQQERQKNYVNGRTVNYIIKYVNKMDKDHPNYKPVVLTSPGIGSDYTKTYNSNLNKFKGKNTDETYRFETGHKSSLPIYYRNKIYTDEEREKLWLQRLDKNERWVGGEKIEATNYKEYFKLLEWYRRINNQLGYGNNEKDFDKIEYEKQQRIINYEKRISKTRNNQGSTDNNMGNSNNSNNSGNNTHNKLRNNTGNTR